MFTLAPVISSRMELPALLQKQRILAVTSPKLSVVSSIVFVFSMYVKSLSAFLHLVLIGLDSWYFCNRSCCTIQRPGLAAV